MRLAFPIKARARGTPPPPRRATRSGPRSRAPRRSSATPRRSPSPARRCRDQEEDLDVPRRQLWTELGYSQQQVLDWEAELAAAPPEPAQPVLRPELAGIPIPGAD